MELVEGELRITLPASAIGRKFDDASHRFKNVMKAVDFIVEEPDRILFIECKDPDQAGATAERLDAFRKELMSDVLDLALKYKYRDSWLHEWAAQRVNKPITYLVLLGLSSLSSADLLRRSEVLKKALPSQLGGAFVHACLVLNLEAWNRHFPHMCVSRLP